jgi:hypothetical protein
MNTSWNLNSKEVRWYDGWATTSLRINSRQSRKVDSRSAEINLVHEPTKIEVKGTVRAGHYSKKEMTQLHKTLYQKLFIELENKVAKFLKIPKR